VYVIKQKKSYKIEATHIKNKWNCGRN